MIARLCASISLPGRVRWMRRPSCSNSGMPTWLSSSLTCSDTAGWREVQLGAGSVKLAWRRDAFEHLELAERGVAHRGARVNA